MKSGTLLVIGAFAMLGLGGYFLAARQRDQETQVSTPSENETTTGTEIDAMKDTDISDTTTDESGVRTFTVENKGMSYTVKGDTVRVTFKVVQGQHDWNLDEFDAHTQVTPAGSEETVEFIADKAGEFEYYCSVPGHRAAGMVGTLRVE